MREIELKFRVTPQFELPDITPAVPTLASVGPVTRLHLKAVYYDTPDLRLARAGITLRRRSGGADDGWHLKLPVSGAASSTREELAVADTGGRLPPAQLQDLTRAHVRFSEIAPVATLLTQRDTFPLLDANGELLAELVDDAVSVRNGRHVASRFREIEVEDKGGGTGLLEEVAAVLRSAGAVGGEFVPKVVRALGPRASAPADPPPSGDVRPKDPGKAALESMFRGYVRALLNADPRVRLGEADSVHQMRVATRRLRSALRTFGALLEPDPIQGLADELAWLAGELGPARDAEVLLARLLADIDALPDHLVIGPARERVASSLGHDLDAAAERVRAALATERYLTLLERVVDLAWLPQTTAAAEAPAAEAVLPLVADTWEQLARRAARLRRKSATEEDHHRVRIAAKRARYAAEAVSPVFGAPAQRFARELVRVQDVLGEHQDAVVAVQELRALAQRPRLGVGPAFTLGVLAARQQEAAAAARGAFADVWADVRRSRHRRWLTA